MIKTFKCLILFHHLVWGTNSNIGNGKRRCWLKNHRVSLDFKAKPNGSLQVYSISKIHLPFKVA